MLRLSNAMSSTWPIPRKGICRVLNLISEQGNSDLGKHPIQTGVLALFIDLASVECIIISQDSLMPGMDGICPVHTFR